MRKDYQTWQDGLKNSIGRSVFFAYFAFMLSFVFIQKFWLPFFIGLGVMVFSFGVILKNHRESTYKFFFADSETATERIRNILNKKGLPYEQSRNRFFVDVLTVTIIKKNEARLRPSGVVIKIRPNKLIYEPLISNLKNKLDDELILDWD